ncbi:citrate synthase [Actinomycetospora sp. CA-084318]|uniref:citrate synthase n=1 Tax=Actinomycetospora sp. CA-084318 TaxID=3239892 RepID=UPI003D98826C
MSQPWEPIETAIAEADREGGALRYRGVDLADLVGSSPFEAVFALLTQGPELPDDGESVPIRTGDVRVDLQAGLAALNLPPLYDRSDDEALADVGRAAAAAHTLVARAARDFVLPEVPPGTVAQGRTAAERFLLRWRGTAEPVAATALDAYWTCAAEHGMAASTFTARVVASTGADAGAALSAAVGALSGPLHGGAPARVLPVLAEVERTGDAPAVVRGILDRGERLMGFGNRVYRAEDPRARFLREVCADLRSPRYEAARALQDAALALLRERRPDRAIEVNMEFWAAVVLDLVGVPAATMPAVFACGRIAGWSAHVLEQRGERPIRPTARYVGTAAG